ncbi:DUF1206 domain-containing protein [Pseudonocardia sp. DSM 110487]|uniref:DUF1206 domain-containing protein n=1 Tax=Pseudonocardia sp. DSM 110487 TaxID=2865833 RepID=UPI001C6A7E3D|nr:DUF1206 domain-containing protein [Pseudonocardia sp. DSM 110487]QYN35714.1 DUF1206 domain-containing protein [Pseudonocardia sp. DSM 110487]
MPRSLARLRRLVSEGRSDAPGRVVDGLGRIGLVGYGVVHLVVAWLALQVAFGVPDAPPDAVGAVGTIARTPGGVFALVVAVIGLFAFALWQLTAAAMGFRWAHGNERMRKRVGAVAKSIAVSALAGIVIDYLMGLGSADGTVQQFAARVLELPAGRVLLGLGAVALIGIAGAMTYTGVRRTFMGDLDVRRLAPGVRNAIEVAGAAGHLARALAIGVVAGLAGAAALFADPAWAGGLDTALRALGSTVAGAWLLAVVAAGFAAFGLFCFADAATRRA